MSMQNTQHATILNGSFYFYATHAVGFLHILTTDLHSIIHDITQRRDGVKGEFYGRP